MPNWNIVKTIRELNESSDTAQVELEEAPETELDELLDRGDLDIARVVQPEGLAWEENWVKIGDEYCCSFYIHTYPNQVDDAWLDPLLHFEHALDVAMYIQPLPVEQFIQRRENELAQDKASVQATLEEERRPNAKKMRRIRDTEELLDAIQNELTSPFQIIIVMTLRAPSVKELERAAKELQSRITSARLYRTLHRHKQGFETTVPLMMNELMDTDNVRFAHTQAIMACFPFTSSDITHETGVLIGLARGTRTPIIINRFAQPPHGDLESPNSVIFGKSGSGKSWLAKAEMSRWVYKGVGVVTLDPSGEYVRVCEALAGQNVSIALDSPDRINPLDFSYAVEPGRNALRNKIAAMSDLLRVMLRSGPDKTEVDAVGKTIFDNALIETYRQYGYMVSDVATQQNATSQHMPRLRDVYRMLQRIGRSDRRPMVQERVAALLAGLGRFVGDGPLAGLFDHHTTVSNLRDSHFINFNISAITQMSHEFVPMAMQLVLEFLRTTMFTEAQMEGRYGNKLLYVDEAQHLMAYPETANFLAGTSRTCRKYGIGLTCMTQDVGVFVLGDDGGENKIGRAILANASTTILLKQHPNELGAVERAFHLTPGEISRLSSAGVGQGLIIVGQESAWFSAQGLAHPAEERMFETSMAARRDYADEDLRQLTSGQAPQLPAGGFLQHTPGLPSGELPPGSPDHDTRQIDDFDDPFGGQSFPAPRPPAAATGGALGDGDDGPFAPLT